MRNVPQEPAQTEARRKTVKAEVPLDAFYKCWHMPARIDNAYYAIDLIVDILGGGASSRLYQTLVKEQQLFSNIDCYHYGSLDRGLLTIEGKLVKGVTPEAAEAAVEKVLDGLRNTKVEEKELQKVKNKTESLMAFEDMGIMNRANSLAFYALIGDPTMMNSELQKYQEVTVDEVLQECKSLFEEQNSTTLYYLATQQQHEHN
jgi:predicted Zn-dependent peptidase